MSFFLNKPFRIGRKRQALSLALSQCSGTSPSHSTPEGFRRMLGSRPRVTARWMRACFCSSSSVISFCLGADVAPDTAIGVVEVANDGGLFGEGWKWDRL